jgi:phage gp29-like protein
LYTQCRWLNNCEYNGKVWNLDEVVKLVYTIATACDARKESNNPFNLVDSKLTEFKEALQNVEIYEKNTDIKDNPNDPTFKDKIIPFLREVTNALFNLLPMAMTG